MKNNFNFLIGSFTLLLILLTIPSCANSVQYITTVGNTESESATIIVVNPRLEGGLTKGRFYINNLLIGAIGEHSYIKTNVACGAEKKVKIKTSLRTNDSEFELTIVPNGEYYFEYDVVTGNRIIPLLRKMSNDEGKILLSQVNREAKLKIRR